jgi:hypothetical protein
MFVFKSRKKLSGFSTPFKASPEYTSNGYIVHSPFGIVVSAHGWMYVSDDKHLLSSLIEGGSTSKCDASLFLDMLPTPASTASSSTPQKIK